MSRFTLGNIRHYNVDGVLIDGSSIRLPYSTLTLDETKHLYLFRRGHKSSDKFYENNPIDLDDWVDELSDFEDKTSPHMNNNDDEHDLDGLSRVFGHLRTDESKMTTDMYETNLINVPLFLNCLQDEGYTSNHITKFMDLILTHGEKCGYRTTYISKERLTESITNSTTTTPTKTPDEKKKMLRMKREKSDDYCSQFDIGKIPIGQFLSDMKNSISTSSSSSTTSSSSSSSTAFYSLRQGLTDSSSPGDLKTLFAKSTSILNSTNNLSIRCVCVCVCACTWVGVCVCVCDYLFLCFTDWSTSGVNSSSSIRPLSLRTHIKTPPLPSACPFRLFAHRVLFTCCVICIRVFLIVPCLTPISLSATRHFVSTSHRFPRMTNSIGRRLINYIFNAFKTLSKPLSRFLKYIALIGFFLFFKAGNDSSGVLFVMFFLYSFISLSLNE